MKHEWKEGTIRTLAVSLVSAAAVAVGVVLLRQPRHEDAETSPQEIVPAGETVASTISLEKLRELGI